MIKKISAAMTDEITATRQNCTVPCSLDGSRFKEIRRAHPNTIQAASSIPITVVDERDIHNMEIVARIRMIKAGITALRCTKDFAPCTFRGVRDLRRLSALTAENRPKASNH